MAELIILGQSKEPEWTENERKVMDIIFNHAKEQYGNLLQGAEWDVFYQLSSMREGIVNWYPFQDNCEVLEVSAGFGALTDFFCRTVRKVTVWESSLQRAECIIKRCEEYGNLTVLAGELRKGAIKRTYDYVFVEKAINTKDDVENIIEKFFPFLKETGRLIFVCENRFGMKYWCGMPDPVSNRPFTGIRGRDGDAILTKSELIEILESSKIISDWNFYYPFPDYKLPQVIYSDRYLPKTSIRDRVIPYYPTRDRDGLVCLENEISDQLIKNGAFSIFSNSFLIECGKMQFEQEIIFAALSTDRGKEHGFATVITSHDMVQKRILYPEGRDGLELLHRNNQELLKHGINCVKEVYNGNFIEMPCVRERSLIEYLKYLYLHNPGAVEAVFDHLYETIQNSSERVDFLECALKNEALNRENAGIVLRRAYIDMIPYNCFYVNGEFLFYDQEFVKEYYPAKYVLFRALRYTYIYILEAEEIIPLQYFMERYDLCGLWKLFESEETKFIEENRNYKLLSSFYQWAEISAEDVDKNIDWLMKKGFTSDKSKEISLFCRKSYNLKKFDHDIRLNSIKKVQMDLLKKFVAVCKEHDLAYCVFYGTLLGAVRHKGYIPWDNDIDVLMPRRDYDILLNISSQVFKSPLFLQVPENDPECYYGGYSKLRNSDTTGIEKRNWRHSCNQGIWIDVFPLDYLLKDKMERKKQYEQIKFYQRLLYKKTYPEQRVLWDVSDEEEASFLKKSEGYSRELLCQKVHDTISKCRGELSSKVGILARYWGERECTEYDEADFAFLIKAKFEDMEVNIPVGYENCLLKDYGEDYAVYPEEKDRKIGHNALYDVEQSYIDYKEKNEYNNLGIY